MNLTPFVRASKVRVQLRARPDEHVSGFVGRISELGNKLYSDIGCHMNKEVLPCPSQTHR